MAKKEHKEKELQDGAERLQDATLQDGAEAPTEGADEAEAIKGIEKYLTAKE